MTTMDAMKTCRICHVLKPLSAFYKNKSTNDGYQNKCKDCCKDYYLAHKASRVEYSHSYQLQNAEILKEKRLAKRLLNLDESKVKQYEYTKKYRARNREITRIHNKRSYQKKVNHPVLMWHYEAQAGECHYCGASLEGVYHVDHVIPLIRGGSDDRENVVLCCSQCNRSKGKKLLHEWRDENWNLI